MHRQAILYATLASAVGLGLVAVARREEMASLIGGMPEEAPPEKWRARLAAEIQETSARIEETRQALEEAARAGQMKAAGVVESAWDTARLAAVTATTTTLWLGAVAAFLVFVYAPERSQQEKLWQTTRYILNSMRGTLDKLGRLGGRIRVTEA